MSFYLLNKSWHLSKACFILAFLEIDEKLTSLSVEDTEFNDLNSSDGNNQDQEIRTIQDQETRTIGGQGIVNTQAQETIHNENPLHIETQSSKTTDQLVQTNASGT